MKIDCVKIWRMPGTWSYYLSIYIRKRNRKTGRPTRVLYSFSTPYSDKRHDCLLLPTIQFLKHKSEVPNAGPCFELRFRWLRLAMKLVSREVYWGDEEDA